MKSITYKGITYAQSDYNYHVMGVENGKMVYHAQTDKPLTKEELLEVAKHADSLLNSTEKYLKRRVGNGIE